MGEQAQFERKMTLQSGRKRRFSMANKEKSY
jgi:hypothetical protein